MTTLSAAQIANVAYRAGFRGDGLVNAVAVALAESSGDTTAKHTNSDGSVDRGLWQFNSRWHPEVSAAAATNPDSAAAAAFRVSKGGTDWHEWATWPVAAAAQSGRARLAVAQVGKGQGVTAASDLTTTSGGVVDAQAVDLLSPGAEQVGIVGDVLGGAGHLLGKIPGLGGIVGGVEDTAGAMVGLTRAAVSAVTLAIRGAAWVANPHNWLRIVEVTGGSAALYIGLKMLADSGIDSPVATAARVGVKAASSTVKAAKKASSASAGASKGGS
jgi:hypothetical protein